MKYSVLNLVPLRENQSYKDAIDDMIELAKKVEKLGYERYWIAEHHNNKFIASSATQLLIQKTLDNTKKIRVGSGGVMLPNHSPYLVAEQYGTLEILHPGRVDLGLGRAPGTDLKTATAIRKKANLHPNFEKDLEELLSYFEGTAEVHAYPGEGVEIPIYILGSSVESAYLASKLGLAYAFAAHFSPASMLEASYIYRNNFKASKYLDKPYFILCYNIILADTVKEAKRLATTQIQSFLNLVTSRPKGLQKPVNSEEEVWQTYIAAEKVPHFGPIAFTNENFIYREKEIVRSMIAGSIIGTKDTALIKLRELKEDLQFDELMVNSMIYDKDAQEYSYKLFSEIASKVE
ncbi:LLM class flavin-dependent oxidoreductase [Gemella sp. 19428wG2_WT2a]|nr:LLM class flavin-dependent oxidoreductase [Gemella sp. 19428wG2_WT2a]TFU60025.1 LLM class flavin-dependent oxidoreductase [Gemella sp. WT2a]